jgi:hypothetical protein
VTTPRGCCRLHRMPRTQFQFQRPYGGGRSTPIARAPAPRQQCQRCTPPTHFGVSSLRAAAPASAALAWGGISQPMRATLPRQLASPRSAYAR